MSRKISPELHISPQLYRHYWRGVFDGDGCLSRYKNSNNYNLSICGNKNMCEGFSDYINYELEISSKLSPNDKVGNCFKTQFFNQNAVKVGRLLFGDATVYLDRKFNKFKEMVGA